MSRMHQSSRKKSLTENNNRDIVKPIKYDLFKFKIWNQSLTFASRKTTSLKQTTFRLCYWTIIDCHVIACNTKPFLYMKWKEVASICHNYWTEKAPCYNVAHSFLWKFKYYVRYIYFFFDTCDILLFNIWCTILQPFCFLKTTNEHDKTNTWKVVTRRK